MRILNQGFDHVEFVLDDIAKHIPVYQRMGFEQVGARALPAQGTRSVLMQQGFIRVMLTQGDGSQASERNPAVQFRRRQDEGICVLAIEVDDAAAAHAEAVKNGAKSAEAPRTFESRDGSVTRAEIHTLGEWRYRFVSRKTAHPDHRGSAPALFDEEFPVSRLESPSPYGLRVIDHLTNNVTIGDMDRWVEWYKKVFGFVTTRHFNIKTGRTGLNSYVVESPDRKIKVPINEATEPESQVQEFVERMKGSGVQHLALLTTDLIKTLKQLRESRFSFLKVPHSYYEVVPTRVPGVTENLAELEELGILLDGEAHGYLLQIFGEEFLGPFFFEFIQRKGNQGFGEGNFRALFEAIERDQIRRGTLKA